MSEKTYYICENGHVKDEVGWDCDGKYCLKCSCPVEVLDEIDAIEFIESED